ncbi:MAG: cupin-like domain-containing protein [Bacteroidia bacterium]|nr:cupin-like domain-containing protein [Bacteroidia bacterium]
MTREEGNFLKSISFGQRLQYGTYQWFDHFFGRKTFFKNRTPFYNKLHETMPKHGEGRIMPLERRKDLSLKEFKEHYVRKGIPVVLEGAAKEWPCVKKWSMQYFKDLHGHDEIVLVDQNTSDVKYEHITLGEVIDNIRSGGSKYYRFYPLLKKHPEHLEDFDYKWLQQRKTPPVWFDAFQVFIGGQGTYSALHCANPPNLFVQVHGQKDWVLYSKYYTAVIDPDPVENIYRRAPGKHASGPFNPFEPNYDPPYDLWKYIDGYSVSLMPGDILWNPPFYWHAVRNASDSIGVGYRWYAPLYSYMQSPLYMSLDCCATNPPIWKAHKLYKNDINELHLAEIQKLEEAKRKKAEKEALKMSRKNNKS